MVFLIEIKCSRERLEAVCNKLGFEHSFVVDCIDKIGGLAMMWKNEVIVELSSYSQSHISLSITNLVNDQ